MRRSPYMSFVSLVLICLFAFSDAAPLLQAQTAAAAPAPAQKSPPPPTAQELDQLLAPIALYPDALLAQMTTASTNPQEILDVTNWLAKNPNLAGSDLTSAAEKQGFDPAFLALVTFPKVLQMMSDHIDDYAAIGLAVKANQADVSASIQRLRAQAYEAGSLRSNEQQKVEVKKEANQTIYVIQPTSQLGAYVPIYNPTVVYVPAPSTTTALITFGVGIGIAALVYSTQPWGWHGWGWGWGHGGVIYYNRGPWGGIWVGGYRPPVYWYHPRPPYYAGYPGYGGNWGYRPPHYHPPYPGHLPAYRPPNYRPPSNGTPGYRPPSNGNRPPYVNNRPPNSGPPTNGNRPTTKPAQPGMGTRPPGGGNQPSTRPARPGAAQPRPAPRPAPRPRPRPNN